MSRNSFLNEKDWKRNTAKISRMKRKAYMGFRRADLKTTKCKMFFMRKERWVPLVTPESAWKRERKDVIPYLNRKGKVFLMNFGS
ncbi:hypothetical protein AVEN_126741-1 [Araneus ventricosus]|uniref:Uncharacterized protein n=1 Tax=Araneus ventricosus TaxID=182803 RepID=A0A4Y2SVN1_ARAVE|nr:hypothetical protein AVEN_126741-1 [Araneus ventricosus]